MDKLLDIIRWNVSDPYRVVKQRRKTARLELKREGAVGFSIPDKLLFVDYAVLCGFQTAQRAMGIGSDSPQFVVDIHMERNPNSTKILRWHIERKDGTTSILAYEPTRKKKWKPSKPVKTKTRKRKDAD